VASSKISRLQGAPMSNFETTFLSERLEELESAANQLIFTIENEDSAFHNDLLLKSNLTKVLTESAAVRRRMAEIKHEQ
jgi:hypothetical protein